MGTQSNLAPSFEWLERRLSFYYEMQLSLDDLIADGTDPLLPAFPDLVEITCGTTNQVSASAKRESLE